MKLRSLFLALTGALILMAFIAPRANATLIVYFNFEDQAPPPSSPPPFNPAPDRAPATIAPHRVGRPQQQPLTINASTTSHFRPCPTLLIAVTPRDPADTNLPRNSLL